MPNRILVVENDPETSLLLSLMLNRENYATDRAFSAQEALKKLEQSDYALMTLDLKLPDRSGLDLLREVRAQAKHQNLPVIVVAADVEESKLAIKTEFQALDWLEKPVEAKKLIDLIQNFSVASSQSKPRILHIEDDPDLRTVIATLGADLAEFSAASTLAQARVLLAQQTYDVVLLDIGLPDGSGWDLLPQIHELTNPPLVAVLTGQDLSLAQRQQVSLAYLKSKTSNESLLTALKQAVARRPLPNRNTAP